MMDALLLRLSSMQIAGTSICSVLIMARSNDAGAIA